jgi:uncharacterized protein (TIGR03086 family)
VGATVVDALGPPDLSRQTPCAGWDVRQVIAHVVGTTMKFTAFALGETERPSRPTGDVLGDSLDDEFRQSYWEAAAASNAAWAKPAPDRPMCRLPFGDFPGEYAARINLFDVLVHGWDLANAVGRAYDPSPSLVLLALDVADRLVTPDALAAGQYRDLSGGERIAAEGRRETPMERLLERTGRRSDGS